MTRDDLPSGRRSRERSRPAAVPSSRAGSAARDAAASHHATPDGASARPAPTAAESSPAPPPLTGGRRTTMFVVVAVALIMSTLDGTIVATALPALKTGLHMSVTLAGWTITARFFANSSNLALAGASLGAA